MFAPDDDRDSVIVTEYEGAASRSETQAARDEYAGRSTSTRYGPVEDLKIDGRAGWCWTEAQPGDGKVRTFQLTAVVPWGDRTYSVEYSSSGSNLKTRAELQTAVESFTVVTKGKTMAWGFLVFGAILLLLVLVMWRAQQPPG